MRLYEDFSRSVFLLKSFQLISISLSEVKFVKYSKHLTLSQFFLLELEREREKTTCRHHYYKKEEGG